MAVDVYMDAGDGRRPFAQVLRNSLSGHPPSTGCDIRNAVPAEEYVDIAGEAGGVERQGVLTIVRG